jgi:putative ABC transport system permease protein
MNDIFGLSTSTLATTLVLLFVVCLGSALAIVLRNRVVFKLGVRNVPRRPAQTILIVIGLMLSTLIISASFTTGDTLSASGRAEVLNVSGQTDERVVQSVSEADTGPQSGGVMPQQAVTDLEARLAGSTVIDGVMPLLRDTVPAIDQRTRLSEPTLTLIGLDPTRLGPFGGLPDQHGKPIGLASLPSDGIVIGATAADKLDAQVGDVLTLYVHNQPQQFSIAAIGQDSLLTGYMPGGSGGLTLPLGRAQALLGTEGLISSIEVTNRGGRETGVKRTDAAMQQLDSALAGTPYRAIATKQNDLADAELTGNMFMTLFLVFGLFSISVGVLLIFLIFVMLAAERRSEMGMARAIGMQRRHLTEMFLAEGIAYDLVAALVGALLGVGVAFIIARWMSHLVGQYISIHPTASWTGLVIAYTLGVVVTFMTVLVSSWRVSRLNIVEAIRDTPEVTAARAGRSWLLGGLLGLGFGLLMLWSGASGQQEAPYLLGLSLLPFSAAMVLRRFGIPARLAYSVAAIMVLLVWIGPDILTDWLYPSSHLNGGIEMFFLSGIALVASSTMLIVWNADLATSFVGLLGRTFSRWLPAVRTSIAYPLERKGRTGMTIAMFSLVIFALVMMASINVNALHMILGSEHVSGGWDVLVTQSPANPITDLRQTLQQNGVDASVIADTAHLSLPPDGRSRVRMLGDSSWSNYTAFGLGNDAIERSDLPLQTRGVGYATDRDVWNAVRDTPGLAIVDSSTIASSASFGSTGGFILRDVATDDRTMQPAHIELNDPTTGTTRELTVIGVVDSSVGVFQGVFMSQATFTQVYPTPGVNGFVVKLQPGVNTKQEADRVEAALVTFGAQATSFRASIDEASRTSRSFLQIIEGFMLLGLVVGIAALGVISFRAVVERRQQIGMLRAIGYRRSMIAASFLIESTLVTLLGVLSGTILGLVLAQQLMASDYFFGGSGNGGFIVPWQQVTVFIGISLAAALLMSWIPARRAARIPIAEALRYE